MNIQELIGEIRLQPTWKSGGQRAPHKALTILFALGRALQGHRIISYRVAEPELKNLLDGFGPPRDLQHPEYPVWLLRQFRGAPTGFWQLEGDTSGVEDASKNPRPAEMREHISFGLSESAWRVICEHSNNARVLAMLLAAEIVPATLHQSLLDAVGIDMPTDWSPFDAASAAPDAPLLLVGRKRVSSARFQRDPAFSRLVRDAYRSECAVCSIAPKLGDELFGLEAAHIRWVNHEGPDIISNGLCLCRMHHVGFDKGAMKVDEQMRVRVSSRLDHSRPSDEMFRRFEGKEIRLPQNSTDNPHQTMLEWHWSEVFKP